MNLNTERGKAMTANGFMLTLALAVAATGVLPARAAEPRVASSPVLEDRYPERRVSFPGAVVGLADLTYSSLTGYRPLVLDLYKPQKAGQPLPLVIYLHGGGWQSGHTRHSGAFEDWPGVLALDCRTRLRGRIRRASPERRSSRLSGGDPRREGSHPVAAIACAGIWHRQVACGGVGGLAGGHLAASPGRVAVSLRSSPILRSPSASRTWSRGTPASQAQPLASAESDCVQGVVTRYGIFDFSNLLHRSAAKRRTRCGDPLSRLRAGTVFRRQS